MRFKIFLEFMSGKPVFYNIEALREKHKHLDLSSRDFNLFKFYLLVHNNTFKF